jgi:ribosomal protein S27E
MAQRLLSNLDRVCAYPWVGEMVTELGAAVGSAQRHWPAEERPVYLPTPCPRCDNKDLVRHAPQTFRGPVTISCRTCGEVVAEDKYGLLTRMVLDEQKDVA